MLIDVFGSIFMVGASYLIIPRFGFNGLALIWSSVYLILTIFGLIIGFNIWGIDKKPIVLPYLMWACALPVSLLLFLKLDGLLLLFAAALAAAAIFILEWFFMRPEEKSMIRRSIAQVLNGIASKTRIKS
jgi:O-antigen/teichoic acid export membrane protein